MRSMSFFTTWSLILHYFYFIGVLPSTWSIAVFVAIAGTAIVLRQVDKMSWHRFWKINALHLVPLFLIKDRQLDMRMLLFWLLVYLCTVGHKKIRCIYKDIAGYMKRERDCGC